MTAINLDTIHLDQGKHSSPNQGHCLLEVVAMFAGKPFTDQPPCVSPVLRTYGIGLNDQWDDYTRQQLRVFIPLLPGTAGDGQDEARSYLALDWLIRTYPPAWLDLVGLAAEAAELRGLRPALERGLEDALDTVRLVSTFDFPDMEQPWTYLSLRPEQGYPIESGNVVTTDGTAFDVRDFTAHIKEFHVPHSNALHATLDGGGPYVVGPLARYTLNHDRLSPLAREAAREGGLDVTCRNPFKSIIVRAVELVEIFVEAIRIIDAWQDGVAPSVPVPARAGEGFGATEAPRGVLFHRYRLDADGTILDAQIVPPTSQNQPSIEADLRTLVEKWIELSDHDLSHRCEHAIRNYDPCISCATHFLDLTVERS